MLLFATLQALHHRREIFCVGVAAFGMADEEITWRGRNHRMERQDFFDDGGVRQPIVAKAEDPIDNSGELRIVPHFSGYLEVRYRVCIRIELYLGIGSCLALPSCLPC